nr:NUDIX domain-containing protein [Corynebacterium lactis]
MSQQSSEPAVPRLAATVLLLRDTDRGVEVYVQERVSSMRFAANMTVFPGGGVDSRDFPSAAGSDGAQSFSDGDYATALGAAPDTAHALVCAAVRETFEETGTLLARHSDGRVVSDSSRYHAQRGQLEAHELSFSAFLAEEQLVLDPSLIRPWANWVTPATQPIRYDTYFFLAAHPEGQVADGNTSEASSTGWFRPSSILDGWRREVIGLMPPTWAELKRVEQFSTVRQALEAAATQPVRRTSSDFLEEPFMDEYFAVATHMGHLRRRSPERGA